MEHNESGGGGFQCARAAELLGHPKATAKDCKEYLPGLWRVVLTGGDFADGWHEVKTFVWRAGQRDTGTGRAALGAYLREARVASMATLDTYAVRLLLEATAGVPEGFAATDLGETLDGVAGGVSVAPFSNVLVRRPALHPPGGGPPPPPGGSPPGGAPVLGVRRATLSELGDRFQWLVEDRGPDPGAIWVEVSRETF